MPGPIVDDRRLARRKNVPVLHDIETAVSKEHRRPPRESLLPSRVEYLDPDARADGLIASPGAGIARDENRVGSFPSANLDAPARCRGRDRRDEEHRPDNHRCSPAAHSKLFQSATVSGSRGWAARSAQWSRCRTTSRKHPSKSAGTRFLSASPSISESERPGSR